MFGIDLFDASLLPAMLVALTAGALSFLSPCVLPIVPPYLAYMGGITLEEMGDNPGAARSKALLAALFFVLGLSTVFIFLGFTASIFGQFFLANQILLGRIAGAVIIVFGAAFPRRHPDPDPEPGGAARCGRPGGLGLRGLYPGPRLRLRLDPLHRPAAGRDPVAGGDRGERGAGHDAPGVYAIGLGIPFLLAAAFIDRAMAVMGG
jgi:cytochrome c-type biogenesis protein